MARNKRILKCLLLSLVLSAGACEKPEEPEKPEVNKYKVTWVDSEDNVLEVDNDVIEGTMPSYDGSTPTKQGNEQYAYTFKGWDKELSKVTSNVVYKAQFDSTLVKAKVTFNLDGGASPSKVDYKYLAEIKAEDFFFDVTKETYKFDGWSYNGTKIFDKNGNKVNNVEIVENMEFKALFDHTVTLTISQNPKTNFKFTGAGTYEYGTKVTVRFDDFFETPGYSFDGLYLNDELYSYELEFEVELVSDLNLVAMFEPYLVDISIASYNENIGLVGFGSLTSVGDNFAKNAEDDIQETKQVTVCARRNASAPNVDFLGWYEHDILVSSDIEYTFTVVESHNLVAKWDSFELTTSSEDVNLGTVSAGGTYKHDEFFDITATPADGYRFVGWYDGNLQVSEDAHYIASMPSNNLALQARFEEEIYYVGITPSHTTSISVSGRGSYKPGETVTLKVEFSLFDYSFVGWYNGDTELSKDTTYTFTMGHEELNLDAKMKPKQYKIDVVSNNEEMGTVTGGGTYDYGSVIKLVATPKEGYHFVQWKDSNHTLSENPTYTFYVGSYSTTITAEFAKN